MSGIVISGGENIPIKIDPPISREEIDIMVDKMSKGSLYAHGDTIKQGYISLGNGIRAGICGRAAYDGGKMIGVNDITGICIRLPHAVKVDVTEICNIIRKDKLSGGVLIYSPPGCGKTTLLRSIAEELAREGQRRVVVVDSRSELEYGLASPMLLTNP